MTAKSKARQPHSPKPVQQNDIEERIRRRAYTLYEEQQQRKIKAARATRC
jgi:hypothetical protein